MITVYVLKLEHGKYYIGKTTRPIFRRITEHFYENGSEWTRHYKPVHVLEVIDNANEFDEDKYTKIYMKKYGIDNVRGGSYTRIELLDYQLKSLQDEFCTVDNLCFKCNKPGHFVKDCKVVDNCESSENDEWEDYEDDEYSESYKNEYYENEDYENYEYSKLSFVLNLVDDFILQNNYYDEYDPANLYKIKSNDDLKCILNTLIDNSKQRIENYKNLISDIKQNITWEELTDIVIMLNKNELKKTGIPLLQNLNYWYMKKYFLEHDDIDAIISSYKENLLIQGIIQAIWFSGGCTRYINELKSELESIDRNMNRLGSNYFSFISQISYLYSRINKLIEGKPTDSISFPKIKRVASDFCKPNFVLKDNSFFKFLEKAYRENDYGSYSHNLSWYY